MDGISPVMLAKLEALPDSPGCYLFKDPDGRVIYVGKAKNLRRRVLQYFQGRGHSLFTSRLAREAADLETVVTDSEVEALLLENALIKDHQPRLNVRLKDDKSFPLVAVTREEFPRVFITRQSDLEGVDFYGPFISATDLYRAYNFLMRVFRFRVCDLDLREDDPKRASFRPCLNFHIKRCSAPCTTRIGREAYGEDIRALRAFITGRGKAAVLTQLSQRMKVAAQDLRFEEAAHCRDQIKALDRLKERGRLRDYDDAAAPTIDLVAGLDRLREALGLPAQPRVIEGFDLAHLQGDHVVAGLVRFVSGVPDKDGYRRFRVRGDFGDSDPGNDDFAGMREVVGRRYRRLQDEGQPFPDLVMIDGGHGQLAKAVQACRELGIQLPCMIGLAKREETVVRPDGSELHLGKRDPGLKLLMYVRDEAHRFCRRYFHLLQRKALKGDGG
ncbi:MAG: excinuclease ABC subunit UvrC [Planctomycetes bacterium]|nr:excinuclease ABC subunit UvrC [Planctomycetota bacterium]